MISTPEVITTKEIITAAIPLVIPGRDMPKYMDPAIQEIISMLHNTLGFTICEITSS